MTTSHRVEAEAFDDTIDGYFPLQVSLAQMLARNGFAAALVTLRYAPIMHIPGLPLDAPVPLTIRAGVAGVIHELSLCATPSRLSGFGDWRWLTPAPSDDKAPAPPCFDPHTRLAEPAYLTGLGFRAGALATAHLGPIAAAEDGRATLGFGAADQHRDQHRDQHGDLLWGPFGPAGEIQHAPPGSRIHGSAAVAAPDPALCDGGLSILYR